MTLIHQSSFGGGLLSSLTFSHSAPNRVPYQFLSMMTRVVAMMLLTALTATAFLRRLPARAFQRTFSTATISMGVRRFPEEPPFPSIDAMTRQLKLQSVLQKGTLAAMGGSAAATGVAADGKTKNVIDQTVVFPTVFLIKVIGANDHTFAQDMVNSVAAVINVLPEQIPVETKITSGGKYQSVTLSPTFQTADEIYQSYAAVSSDKRVKFVM